MIEHLSPQPRCTAVDRTGERCARPEGHGDEKHNAYNGRPWIPAPQCCVVCERESYSIEDGMCKSCRFVAHCEGYI